MDYLTLILNNLEHIDIIGAVFIGGTEKLRDDSEESYSEKLGVPVQFGISDNKRVELPFVLRLKDFSLEEYPPHIHRVCKNEFSKQFVPIVDRNSKGILDSWQVECLEYLDMAGRLHEDSSYVFYDVCSNRRIRTERYYEPVASVNASE